MQTCTQCQEQSADGAKFCRECGNRFGRACPACGHPADGGRFCAECGSPLAGAAAEAPSVVPTLVSPVSERRTTTVLFGDLVSFTTLSEHRDPEEVRELLSSYFSVARTVVGRYGGTVEKFIGDAVMAVWGVPVSHEDDAERAVRAGLDLVREVAALGSSVGAPEIGMRVGVVTGSVAVTLGAVGEGMVAGDAVNTAARVQTAAEPGTVWVDQETQGLTAAAVAFSDMGEHALKGKAEPVRLFRAEAVVAAVGGAQRVDGLEAPMVGREAELRTVRELMHATEQDGRARVAVVTGDPGLGKSRLGWEFEKYVDGLNSIVRWHRGRSLSYGEGMAFWAFAEMVRSRLGLLESDGPAEVDEKVRAGIAEVALSPSEAAWLTPRVAALLGRHEGEVFERTDLFASWTTFLERVGGDDLIILLFEDMQYADRGLLDLVDHLLATSRAKLFVLVLARPELLERRAGLAEGRRTTLVDLAPLPEPAMTSLVAGLVDGLPDRAMAALVARAAGVPLYAVETVRSLIDRDAVVDRDGRYVFVDHDHQLVDLDQLTAPITLQTLIAARLDTLGPAERRAVQDASVLGLAFPRASLEELSDLSPAELDSALDALMRKGVLATDDDPRSPERGQYRFLQAIVREVAYSTLARKDRRARHLAVAAHLEGEQVADAASGVIARHLLDALEASPADDPARASMLDRARSLLVASAVRAEALGSPSEALRSTLAALDLDPEPEEAADHYLRAARLAMLAGDVRRGEDLAIEARSRLDRLGRPRDAAAAAVSHARCLMGQGRIVDADAVGAAALARADDDGGIEAGTRIELLMVQGASARASGDVDKEMAFSVQIMQIAEESGTPELIVRALNSLAIALVDYGAPTAYTALLEAAVRRARDGHLINDLGRSLSNLLSETYPNDLEAAGAMARECIAVQRQIGDNYQLEIAFTNAGFCWLLRGEWDHLTAELDEWVSGREVTSATGALALGLARVQQARGEPIDIPDIPDSQDPYEQLGTELVRAIGRAAEGDLAGAAAMVSEKRWELFEDSHSIEDFEMMWAPAMELQLQAGDLGAAERLMAVAGPLLGGRARPLTRGEVPRLRGMLKAALGQDPEADLREAAAAHESYAAPYLLAVTRLELARWLVSQGRTAEAAPLLAQARPVFAELRAVPALAAVDELSPVPVTT